MKKVLVIQRSLPHYRVLVYNELRKKLANNGIELTLVYGKLKNENASKKDEVDIEWATYLESKVFTIKNIELYWQPCLSFIKGKDMVIVEQANKNLINYILLLTRLVYKQKLAYWGHGRNMQISKNAFFNRFKSYFITICDWWFAYTQGVKEYLIAQSFPAEKITAVQNSIDTRSLSTHYDSLTNESVQNLRTELGIASAHVAIYCGGIYKEKRMEFLVESCDKIKEEIKDFHILIIGSGPDATIISEAASSRDWIHYLGPKFELDRVKYFKLASLFMMPGLVGLAILDSFALRTPMITTDYPYHSPEIEYLNNGVNGLITENTLESYVTAVVDFFQHPAKREKLAEGCQQSSVQYTVEQMVTNLADGIIKCLNQ
ncbi:MAG: glycosyltransferase family 4 protein [Bacteroidota bacterium]